MFLWMSVGDPELVRAAGNIVEGCDDGWHQLLGLGLEEFGQVIRGSGADQGARHL